MNDEKTSEHKMVNLDYPVTVNGEAYSYLMLRRSKVKDRLLVAKLSDLTDEEKEIRFFANLCNVAPDVIQELDEVDYKQLSEGYMSFFTQKESVTSEKLLSSSQK